MARSSSGRGLREHATGPLLAIATFLVLAVIVEVGLRLAAPQGLASQEAIRSWVLKGMYVADQGAGYRLAPDFAGTIVREGHATEFSTNSMGLRGDEVGPKRGPRILALGDSFTWGWGVPQGEEWIHVAGRALADREGTAAVDTVNAGVNGYGTDGAIAMLERIGGALEPDLVLLGFYWGNDLADNLIGAERRYAIRDGYLFDLRAHERYRESFLVRHSHLFRLIDSAATYARERFLGEERETTLAAPGFTRWEMGQARAVSEQLIVGLAERARDIGAAFGVVWIPEVRYVGGVLPPLEVQSRVRFRRAIEKHGIPTIDLRAALSTVRPLGEAYLEHDGHLSARGHSVAGEAVAEWILAKHLLPSPRSEGGP